MAALGTSTLSWVKPFPRASLKAVIKDIRAYFEAHPEATQVYDAEFEVAGISAMDMLDGCVGGRRPGNSGFDNAFHSIVAAHVITHDPEAYELAGRLADALMNNKTFKSEAGRKDLERTLRFAKREFADAFDSQGQTQG